MTEDDAIREVIEQEKRRGARRRPLDPKGKEERRKRLEDLKALIAAGDERTLIAALLERGWTEESAEFQNALKVFRAGAKKQR